MRTDFNERPEGRGHYDDRHMRCNSYSIVFYCMWDAWPRMQILQYIQYAWPGLSKATKKSLRYCGSGTYLDYRQEHLRSIQAKGSLPGLR